MAAIAYLKKYYKAPNLAIGHSLGSTGVIYASAKAESIKTIATLGKPSDTKHVKHLFDNQIESVIKNGEAVLGISVSPFKIREPFLRDINEQMLTATLNELRIPILICHSPQDVTVGIHNGERSFLSTMHPESFLSVDGVDHLITYKEYSDYLDGVVAVGL
jgi:putative redox protein